jgi:hypothetical protein
MQNDDKIPVIFPEEAGLPFPIALPPDDVDSMKQAISMVPAIDQQLHNSESETTLVLFGIGPTVKGSPNGLPIPVPVLDRASEGREVSFCFDATVMPYILPLVTEPNQETEETVDHFPFVKIPIPTAHPPVKNFRTAIDFHWPIVLEQGGSNPRTALLVIPLPFPNSYARRAAVEAEKWIVG